MDSNELMTFATRVLERVLQKCGYMQEPVRSPGMPGPSDVFIDNLAGKVIEFVQRADANVATRLSTSMSTPAVEQLRARNARVALALGACDCFGDDVTCARCGGRGAPGWQVPDRSHFEATIRPALTKVAQFRVAARNGHLHGFQR